MSHFYSFYSLIGVINKTGRKNAVRLSKKSWEANMNIFKKSLIILIAAIMYLLGSTGCSAGPGGMDYDWYPSSKGETTDGKNDTDVSRDDRPDKNGYDGMTACAWDDNENYSYWLQMFEKTYVPDYPEGQDPNGDLSDGSTETSEEQQQSVTGKLYKYKKSWGLDSENRVTVTVKDGTTPISGARVICYNGNNEAVYAAQTNANGVAYLFPSDNSGKVEVANENGVLSKEFDETDREITFTELSGFEQKSNLIEIMLVVDVTGSMGDEIRFLKNQLESVIDRVSVFDNETTIKLAMLFYRDSCDRNEFTYYDFEDVTRVLGMRKQLNALSQQYADGGGDYPESVDKALEIAANKQWSSSNSTKLIFHVLDAPPHNGQQYQTVFKNAVYKAAEKGIRICPILASGADMLTEYLTRQEAILTGGTFVFVTDDSGNGNAHYDPKLPVMTVERLDSLMVRLIRGYHTGTFEKPVFWLEDTAATK